MTIVDDIIISYMGKGGECSAAHKDAIQTVTKESWVKLRHIAEEFRRPAPVLDENNHVLHSDLSYLAREM